MALQACFDLEANARQELVAHVRFELSEKGWLRSTLHNGSALDASESFVPQFCRLNEVMRRGYSFLITCVAASCVLVVL